MAKSMIAMKANKKMVQNHLMKDTGKVVLLNNVRKTRGSNVITNISTTIDTRQFSLGT
jgi:3-polyprenyl-4-hydroxybenzoate decarboxylase